MRREGRLSPPVPVVHALAQIVFAREPRVHAATRPSLRPLHFEEGERRCKARAIAVARIPTRAFPVIARSVATTRPPKRTRAQAEAIQGRVRDDLDCFAIARNDGAV